MSRAGTLLIGLLASSCIVKTQTCPTKGQTLVSDGNGGWTCATVQTSVAGGPTGTTGATGAVPGWSALSSTIPSSADWPGQVPYSALPAAPAGSLLVSNGTGWHPATLSDLGIVTTQPLNLFVRPDGSDTACSGQANQPASAAPNCAFASPQQAVDAVPSTILHAVTIHVGNGTYFVPTGQAAVLDIQRTIVPEHGSLNIMGGTAVTLSGATAATPESPTASSGVLLTGGTTLTGVTLQNLTITQTTSNGVYVYGSSVVLSDITVAGPGQIGILCDFHSVCVAAGTVAVTGATSAGVALSHGSELTVTGSLTSSNNTSGACGVEVTYGSGMTAQGPVIANHNSGHGMLIDLQSRVILSGAGTFMGNGGDAIQLDSNSSLAAGGGLTLGVAAGESGIHAAWNSVVYLAGSTGITINCNGAGADGITLAEGSTFEGAQFTGALNINGCTTGVIAWASSTFDANTATGSFTNNTNNTSILTNAVYFRGNLPAGMCGEGATCE
jgi:hypothetical protein